MLSQAATIWHKLRFYGTFGQARRAPQSRIRVLRHASADAVAAPQESSKTQAMPRGSQEPRKLLGNNRRPQPGCVAPLSLPAPGNGLWWRRQVHAEPSWLGSQPRRRLRRKSAAVTLGAAPRRAASSTAQTAATRLGGRRAGPQDSPAHSPAPHVFVGALQPCGRVDADLVTQDGKRTYTLH